MAKSHQLSFTDGTPITLEQMLDARDQRAARQKELLNEFDKPLVVLTLVIPGEYKNSSAAEFLFDEGVEALNHIAQQQGWKTLINDEIHVPTGPEGFFVFNTRSAETIKRATLALEETHPLGRLWDIDVIDHEKGAVSRSALDIAPRQCLICNDVARACARSQKHSIEDLMAAMLHIISNYQKAG